MSVTTNEVREALSGIDSARFETDDLFDGVRVTVHEDDAGKLFQQIRERGFEAQSKRLGQTLVAHIEAKRGLGELFG